MRSSRVTVSTSPSLMSSVGKYEVTFDEWDACVTAGACNRVPNQDGGWGRGSMPAIRMNWFEAKAYLGWLTRKTGKTYRMPSEAEWEYVARAGSSSPFWWGFSITPSKANYDGNHVYAGGQKGESRKRPLPVTAFDANPLGLMNILGNVYEWTEDCWHPNYEGAPSDGSAWTTGECRARIIRGGSWATPPVALRASNRAWLTPDTRGRDVGLRVVRELN
jgi:formylglycine-generating enzyme required for sulfatase activity